MKTSSFRSASLCAAALAMPLLGTSQAAVNFAFDYSDPSNGSLWTADRIASLERAADVVENLFLNYNATIEVQVKSENNPTSSTLASAGSNPDLTTPPASGFATDEVVMREILTGSDTNGALHDAVVNVNWGVPWSTSSTAAGVSATDFDFESTMSHELLHAVGFLSTISQTGTDGFGDTMDGDWNPFDQYIANSAGLLINQTTFDINQSAYTAALTGGAGTGGLSFNGPNAMAANGGNPVFLYTPNVFEDGSSGSHLDDQFAPYMFMMEASTLEGPGIRGIGAVERGILMDIGYTQLVPEPSTGLLAGFAASLLLLRRRRS